MNIVITGASKGIGFATAVELSKDLNNQIFAIGRNKADLQNLQDLIFKTNNNKIQIIEIDLTNIDIEKIQSLFKNSTIDVLINNAGVLINKPFEETSLIDWQNQFNTNLFSVVNLVQLLLPNLKKSTNAHIVNISSMAGFQSSKKFIGLSVYAASKAALANLTETLAVELKEYNIFCNCLCLGAVQTNMFAQAFPNLKATITPETIAPFIANFALTAQKIMNGKIIPVTASTP